MPAPQVPIEVDPETGVWSTDGLPMLYVPRHFFVNHHMAIEQELGREKYASQVYEAGYRSAHYWCKQEAQTHMMSGIDVFHHYLRRLSQRGWGQFDGSGIDPASCCGVVRLDHSAFVLAADPKAPGKVCYLFAGWFPGALEWVSETRGESRQLAAHEARCVHEGHPSCEFEVRPK